MKIHLHRGLRCTKSKGLEKNIKTNMGCDQHNQNWRILFERIVICKIIREMLPCYNNEILSCNVMTCTCVDQYEPKLSQADTYIIGQDSACSYPFGITHLESANTCQLTQLHQLCLSIAKLFGNKNYPCFTYKC